jgi:hypothetical protein
MKASVYGLHPSLCALAAALCFLAHRRPARRWAWWAGCSALAGAAAVFLLSVSEPREWFSDFNKAYYPAGRLILENPRGLYTPPDLGFVNLPVMALGFTPLSGLPLGQAQLLFALLGAAAIALSCRLLVSLTGAQGWRAAAIVLAFALNGPLVYSFREGNLTHVVLLLLVLAACCCEHEWDACLGVLLAAAALIKLPLFLLPAYYAARGRWRVVASAAATTLAVVVASLVLFGVDANRRWIDDCIRPFLGKPLSAWNIQSVSGLLARLLTDRGLGDWVPFEPGPGFKLIHNALVGCLVAAAAWTFYRAGPPRTPGEKLTELCAVLCLALVISPISWTHYYLLLLLPVGLCLGGRLVVPARAGWALAAVLAALLAWPPVVGPAGGMLGRLLASNYLAGGVALLGVLLAARRREASMTVRAVPPAPPGRLGVAGAYLCLALLVALAWTYFARTELGADNRDFLAPSGERYSSRFCSTVNLAKGKALAPFVHRRLLPDLARGLASVIPPQLSDAMRRCAEGDGVVGSQLRRQGWHASDFPLLASAHLLIYTSVVGFMFACRWLVLLLYDRPGWLADLAGAVLGVALVGGMGDRHYSSYPYDLPHAFVFALALAALVGRRWWFVPVFAVACYSKETAGLLVLAYALLAPDRRSWTFWGVLGLLGSIFAAVRLWILAHYPAPEGDFWFPGRNAQYLGDGCFYLWFAPFFVVGAARLLGRWREYPLALRKLCLLLGPVLAVAFFKGWIEELRQYLEFLPIVGLIVFQWIVQEAGGGRLLRVRSDAPLVLPRSAWGPDLRGALKEAA